MTSNKAQRSKAQPAYGRGDNEDDNDGNDNDDNNDDNYDDDDGDDNDNDVDDIMLGMKTDYDARAMN